MLIWFYRLPIWIVCCGTVIILITWAKFCAVSHVEKIKKYFDLINVVGLVFSIYLVLRMTVIGRSPDVFYINTKPLQSFIDAKVQPEMYRTMLMNLVLFVPLGITLSTLFSKRFSTLRCIIYTFVLGTAFSSLIELIQYVFHLGLCQTDDILCNAFGCLLGSTPLLLVYLFKKQNCN